MDKKLARTIGSAARAARLRAGLTQEDVAELVGTATEVYGRLERGQMLPSVPRLVKLSCVLAVSATEMLGLDPPELSAPPADSGEDPLLGRLLRRVRALGRRQVHLLAEVEAALRGARR